MAVAAGYLEAGRLLGVELRDDRDAVSPRGSANRVHRPLPSTRVISWDRGWDLEFESVRRWFPPPRRSVNSTLLYVAGLRTL